MAFVPCCIVREWKVILVIQIGLEHVYAFMNKLEPFAQHFIHVSEALSNEACEIILVSNPAFTRGAAWTVQALAGMDSGINLHGWRRMGGLYAGFKTFHGICMACVPCFEIMQCCWCYVL